MTYVRTLCMVALTAALTAACSSSDGSLPSSPSAPTSSNPAAPSSNLEAELTFCVNETNRYRATQDLSALTRSGALEAYAAAGAQEDGLAHAPHQHFRSTNGGGLAWAENEIPWWSATSSHAVIQQGLAMMWAEGPGGGHYENMRGPYTQLGCGVFANGNEITVVQDFR